MNEKEYDQFLRIRTVGTLELLSQSVHNNRYEATPYQALDALFNDYELTKMDHVVDYGCGKGRLSFYLHHHFRASVTGIEMSVRLHQDANNNLNSYLKTAKQSSDTIEFENCLAQDYEVRSTDSIFYFFNPFSIQIFMKVVENILRSVDLHLRAVDLILYYPTTEYIQFLETRTTFEFLKEVKVHGLYEHNENERFLIFRLWKV
ncbi:SAM-dependent methyltransferase [Paenisporosarcina indica]|uniref:SAM-dependent methyltransferase n=1 Tax=Paenisporosarcina indica TaxID=650093 RepID=UPI000950265E|nr:methyltransferase domain-containing protein [Paenisporosarcina indica]